MRYPTDNFITEWNTTAGNGFGIKTDYGFHEANDLNNNQGGNADLGKPLFAIEDGEITSVHTHSGSPTFGKHLHLKFQVDGKTYWAHYAHCNEIFVTEGQHVKEGDRIATVGNTGAVYAHCHFAIKNQPTGIDGLARTQADLAKWENPIPFIKKHMTTNIDIVAQLREERDRNWNYFTGLCDIMQVQHNFTVASEELKKLVKVEDVIVAKDKQIEEANRQIEQLNIDVKELTTKNEKLETDVGKQKTEIEDQRESLKIVTDQLEELKKVCNMPVLSGFKKFIYDVFIK